MRNPDPGGQGSHCREGILEMNWDAACGTQEPLEHGTRPREPPMALVCKGRGETVGGLTGDEARLKDREKSYVRLRVR